ncbi:DUF397 domain-containing protein [Streptomyces sp. NPDC004542]|uniref:DUF397 domain-containing protein n=1 Tax=Streptomyces sp. NPDC004542 TaxID=3154281 RepID=UPI00339E5EA8
MSARLGQKSSYCQEGEACVHISRTATTIRLTESADPAHTTLTTHSPAFAALLGSLKARPGRGSASE